jgi:carboxylate-amine ligase
MVNAGLNALQRGIAIENKWRAQRYGVEATFASVGGAVSAADVLEDAVDRTGPDAEMLRCIDQVNHCRAIVAGGTSADEQLRRFTTLCTKNKTGDLHPVLRWIAGATLSQCKGA